MQEFDFTTSIGCLLVRASQAYERALNAELAPRGITFRQSQVLGWLAAEGELSQSDLADRMHLEPPTLVGILDRMERDGWISRHDCPDDRRKKIIRTQSQADPIWSDIIESVLRLRTRGFSSFGPEKIQLLRDLLSALLANLEDDNTDAESKDLATPA